jgi:hypothetical protein
MDSVLFVLFTVLEEFTVKYILNSQDWQYQESTAANDLVVESEDGSFKVPKGTRLLIEYHDDELNKDVVRVVIQTEEGERVRTGLVSPDELLKQTGLCSFEQGVTVREVPAFDGNLRLAAGTAVLVEV